MSVVMNNVTTHPSVRLKGAENVYEPTMCQAVNCSKKYMAHMHCPFCVRTEFYTDPVILKSHYRVKHIDKGIEFAGLKIARCCDHCDIVGSIKGSKEIKGAHWHCFRCKNGFNRRDEALKHYRTHFRNAQTTFQIQITQDVNQTHTAMPFPDDMVATSTSQEIISVSEDRCLQVSVAANETVDTTTSGDLSTGMVLPSGHSVVIQADGRLEPLNANIFNHNNEEAASSSSLDVWSHQHPQLLSSVVANPMKTDAHQTPTSDAEMQIQQLQLQVRKQAAEIEAMRLREVDLLSRLEVHLDNRVVQLLEKMKAEHEELLHRQLEELRLEYLRHIAPCPSSATPSHCSSVTQPLLIVRGGYNGQRIQIVPAKPKSNSGFASYTSSILPSKDAEVAEEEDDDGKDTGDFVDELISENVQNFIVAADDMSEYIDTEDGISGDAEMLPGNNASDTDGDEVDVPDEPKKRKADGSDCGTSPKRGRL